MSYPHIPAVLAYERQDTLLEEAQAARRAREARAYRRAHREQAADGSWFRRIPARLVSAGSRPLTSQPRSRSAATG